MVIYIYYILRFILTLIDRSGCKNFGTTTKFTSLWYILYITMHQAPTSRMFTVRQQQIHPLHSRSFFSFPCTLKHGVITEHDISINSHQHHFDKRLKLHWTSGTLDLGVDLASHTPATSVDMADTAGPDAP